MTQSNRLMQLLEIEQRHEEQAGEILQNCKHSYQLASDMLEQLVEHTERYMSKLTRSRSVGATPEEMRNFAKFLSSIEEALQQQQRQIDAASRDLEKSRMNWQAKHQRCSSLSKLISRHQKKEADDRRKTAERRLDESFSTRLHQSDAT